jgi:lon-related putative ATP-dependent protease
MIKAEPHPELPVEKLRWRCDPRLFKFKTTDDLTPCEGIIGQARAESAVQLGLAVKGKGYNVFVTGLVGTGRTFTVRHLLEKLDKTKEPPDDVLYVNNFSNPDMPRAITLPAGKGSQFKRDMEFLVNSLLSTISGIFASEEYKQQRKEIVEIFKQRQAKIIEEFEKKVAEEGFVLVQVQMGPYVKPDLQPVVEEKPVGFKQLEALAAEQKFPQEKLAHLKRSYQELHSQMETSFAASKEIIKDMEEALESHDKRILVPVIEERIAELKRRYTYKSIAIYLNEVQEDVVAQLDFFREPKRDEQPQGVPQMFMGPSPEDPLRNYRVNLLVDNSQTEGAPIIIETSPSYRNLFGTIERVMERGGVWKTDFTMIKPGSILRANGGYLVMNALDALLEPGVWPALKRALKFEQVEIQSFDPFYFIASTGLKPEPIDTELKVVLIGDEFIYQLLYHRDEDFKKVFKVKAEFDSVMPRDDKIICEYASFIKKITEDENLLPFTPEGSAAVIEFAVRLAGKHSKITTRFTSLSDLICEASYWAEKAKAKMVAASHVERAINEWKKRHSLTEDKIQEMIEEGDLLIDTKGAKVGQVNGLSVYNVGQYSFGKPTRITAQASLGRAGVINIEREAELSGPTHNKGVLILSGYLQGKYAQDKPLVMNASICFEQSYAGVDGDSASSTEIYAILSSLAEVPIRQDLAVTGSVNQKGEIQPIGGVNQKIEGHFDVCKARRLTGSQGVLIPHQNVDELMLKREVVEAVEKGKFHIYAIETIDEGIEILTGVKAGVRQKDGEFEEGTVNYLADNKLKELAESWRRYIGNEIAG